MFTLTKEQTDLAVSVCKFAASRHANQGFECVLIEADSEKNTVTLTAGDSIVEIVRVINCDVQLSINAAVNAAKFSQSIAACKTPTVLIKDQMTVKSGRRVFNIHTVDPAAYPSYPEAVKENEIDINPIDLIDAIKTVSFAAAKNDVRHILNGVFIGANAVATNGHRICIYPLGIKKDAIISIEAVSKIPTDISGKVYLSDNVLSIVSDEYSFKCKLIDGRYVPYEKIIPKKFVSTVTVSRADFIDAVKAAKINSPESGNVQFKFGKESEIKSRSGKNEDAVIGFDCESSKEFEIGFNSSYLIEALSMLTLESIDMKFTDSQVYIEQAGVINLVSMVRI